VVQHFLELLDFLEPLELHQHLEPLH
jgi:hypothetical protein